MCLARTSNVGIGLLITAFTLAVAAASLRAADQEAKKKQRHTVTASVEGAVGEGAGIRAKKVPGRFTVPEGSTATDFKYSFHDPESGYQSDRLSDGSIYSITEQRYITPHPDGRFSLPPGKYKFVVGGHPGSSGVLTYTIVPDGGEDDADNPLDEKTDRVIDIVTWVAERPETKTPATLYVRGNQVTGKLDHTYEAIELEHFSSEPSHTRGTFTGTIAGRTITGTWKLETAPYTCTIRATDSTYTRVDSHRMTIESRIELRDDGTLTETHKGSGTSEWTWSADAPREIAGKHDTHDYEYTIPGEHIKEPIQGTWKERRP